MIRRVLGFCAMAAFLACWFLASLPRWKDPNWWATVPRHDFAQYYQALGTNLTLAGRMLDVGLGVLSLAVSLLFLAESVGVREPRDLRRVKTPPSIHAFYVLANLTVIGFAVEKFFSLIMDLSGGLFPYWAGRLWAPLGGVVPGTAVLLVVANAGIAATVSSRFLPVSLWCAPQGAFGWTVTLVVGLLVLATTASIAEGVVAGRVIDIPGYVAVLYLLLSARAAASFEGVPVNPTLRRS